MRVEFSGEIMDTNENPLRKQSKSGSRGPIDLELANRPSNLASGEEEPQRPSLVDRQHSVRSIQKHGCAEAHRHGLEKFLDDPNSSTISWVYDKAAKVFTIGSLVMYAMSTTPDYAAVFRGQFRTVELVSIRICLVGAASFIPFRPSPGV